MGLTRCPRRAAAAAVLAAGLGGGCASPPAGPSDEAVACELDYGGELHRAVAFESFASYDDTPVAVGSYFLFRIVFERRPAELAAVRLSTYADLDTGPALIHQARHPYPLPEHDGRAYGFTGLQTVHEPVRDGELRYWCRLTRVPRSPP